MRITILILLCLGISTTASAGKLSPLTAWKGKYPFNEVDGQTLWQFLPLHRALVDVLGVERYQTFERMEGPSPPVDVVNGFVLVEKCKAGSCDNHFHVFVDLRTDAVFVCQRTTALAEKGRALWFALDRKLQVEGSCDPDEVDENGNYDPAARIAVIPPSLR